MKYINDWKLFETKLTKLVDLVGKKNPAAIDGFLKKLVPQLFMKQFGLYLQKKLPKKFIKKYFSFGNTLKNLPERLQYLTNCDISIKTYTTSYARGAMNIRIHIWDDYNIRASNYKNKILLNYTELYNSISTENEFYFKEEVFEKLLQDIYTYIAEYYDNHLSSMLNEPVTNLMNPVFLNKYFTDLKNNCPELLNKIATTSTLIKASPKDLNFIRTHLPTLFQEIKSLQKPGDEWSTDLQADAGEYGL